MVDPEKLNPFLDSLIDPFREKEEFKNNPDYLQTLWFQANEDKWLKKRNKVDFNIEDDHPDINPNKFRKKIKSENHNEINNKNNKNKKNKNKKNKNNNENNITFEVTKL